MTTEPNTKSFDTIWVESELVAEKTYEGKSEKEVLDQLSDTLNEYKEIYNLTYNKEILSSLKRKKFGEILFLLTYFSGSENINVYPLLQETKILNEIRDIKLTNLKDQEVKK
jgi:hypothetical protein